MRTIQLTDEQHQHLEFAIGMLDEYLRQKILGQAPTFAAPEPGQREMWEARRIINDTLFGVLGVTNKWVGR